MLVWPLLSAAAEVAVGAALLVPDLDEPLPVLLRLEERSSGGVLASEDTSGTSDN